MFFVFFYFLQLALRDMPAGHFLEGNVNLSRNIKTVVYSYYIRNMHYILAHRNTKNKNDLPLRVSFSFFFLGMFMSDQR